LKDKIENKFKLTKDLKTNKKNSILQNWGPNAKQKQNKGKNNIVWFKDAIEKIINFIKEIKTKIKNQKKIINLKQKQNKRKNKVSLKSKIRFKVYKMN